MWYFIFIFLRIRGFATSEISCTCRGLDVGLAVRCFFFLEICYNFFFLESRTNFFFFNWRVFLNLIKGVPNFFLRVNK